MQAVSTWLQVSLKALSTSTTGGRVTATEDQLNAFHAAVTRYQSRPSLTPVSPQSHPGLAPVSPRSRPGLAPVSPLSHPGLTPVSPRSHPSLAPVSPRSHPGHTPVSPQSHPCLTPVSPPGLTPGFAEARWTDVPSLPAVVTLCCSAEHVKSISRAMRDFQRLFR